jgi:hypothetical protein
MRVGWFINKKSAENRLIDQYHLLIFIFSFVRYGNNPNLCGNGANSCQILNRKKSSMVAVYVTVPIVALVVIVLLLVLLICMCRKQGERPCPNTQFYTHQCEHEVVTNTSLGCLTALFLKEQ